MGRFLAYDGNRVPNEPVVLNENSALSRSLVGLWLFNTKQVIGGAHNLVGGDTTLSPRSSAVIVTPGPNGIGIEGSVGGLVDSRCFQSTKLGVMPLGTNVPVSVGLHAYTRAVVQDNGIWNIDTDEAVEPKMFMLNDTTFRVQHGGGHIEDTTLLPPVPGFWTCMFTFDGTTLELYLNGISKGSDTGTHVPGNFVNQWAVSARDDGFRDNWDGWVYDCAVWDRGLTAGEALHFHNPQTRWDLYYESARRMNYFAAGGRTMGSLAGLGGLAGSGGIAGSSGGIAA